MTEEAVYSYEQLLYQRSICLRTPFLSKFFLRAASTGKRVPSIGSIWIAMTIIPTLPTADASLPITKRKGITDSGSIARPKPQLPYHLMSKLPCVPVLHGHHRSIAENHIDVFWGSGQKQLAEADHCQRDQQSHDKHKYPESHAFTSLLNIDLSAAFSQTS